MQCRVVVAWGGFDDRNRAPATFRSWRHSDPRAPFLGNRMDANTDPELGIDLALWKIARATTAVPTYFAPMQIGDARYVDGAVGGFVNPSDLIYREVKQAHPEREPFMVISIGSGKRSPDQPGASQRTAVPVFGDAIQAIKEAQRTLTDADRSHETLSRMIDSTNNARPSEEHVFYYRFDVPSEIPTPDTGMGGLQIDEWQGSEGKSTKFRMEEAVASYLKDCDEVLMQSAQKLVELRRRRQSTMRWESFALDLHYACPLRDECAPRTFTSRLSLRAHAVGDHRILTPDASTGLWTCVVDSCKRGPSPTFQHLDDCKSHMRAEHGVECGMILTVEEMEGWLDRGRYEGRGPDDNVRPWLEAK